MSDTYENPHAFLEELFFGDALQEAAPSDYIPGAFLASLQAEDFTTQPHLDLNDSGVGESLTPTISSLSEIPHNFTEEEILNFTFSPPEDPLPVIQHYGINLPSHDADEDVTPDELTRRMLELTTDDDKRRIERVIGHFRVKYEGKFITCYRVKTRNQHGMRVKRNVRGTDITKKKGFAKADAAKRRYLKKLKAQGKRI